jgi:hypothetical protein
MVNNARAKQGNSLDKLGIKFRGPVLPEQWPDFHKGTFGAVKRLGETRFEEYKKNARKHVETAPWELRNYLNAKYIAEFSDLFKGQSYDEAGLRVRWESELMKPLQLRAKWYVECHDLTGEVSVYMTDGTKHELWTEDMATQRGRVPELR